MLPSHPSSNLYFESLSRKFEHFIGELPKEEQEQLVRRFVAPDDSETGLKFEFPLTSQLLIDRISEKKTDLHDVLIGAFSASEWTAGDLEKLFSMLCASNLKEYDLETITNIKFDHFDELSKQVKDKLTVKLVETLLISCPNIEMLSFGKQKEICIKSTITFIKAVPNLRELSLENSQLKPDEINQILSGAYPTIKVLNLSHCKINAETIRILTEKFKTLESINLDNASFVLSGGNDSILITRLLTELKHLKYINLGGFDTVNDTHIKLIAKLGEQLSHLHITSGYVNNKAISDLSRSCSEIVSLSLPNCSQIDDTALDGFVLRLKGLRRLNICGTAITKDPLLQFIKDHPKLKGAEIITNCMSKKETSESDVEGICESKSITLTIPEKRTSFPSIFWSMGFFYTHVYPLRHTHGSIFT